MSDAPPKHPYRSADERAAPVTWEGRSSRVLGALARLSKAHGEIERSEVLDERARAARMDEQGAHALGRCVLGHEALARGAYAEAEAIYRAWLVLAAASTHRVRDRLEVLSAQAAAAFACGSRVRAEGALRHAVLLAREARECTLWSDAPTGAVIVLASVFRRLGEPHVGAALLATTSGTEVRPLIVGAWEHAWAEVELSLGDLEGARAHARLAAATRYAAIGPGSPAHTATRALLGRILLASGELDEADEVLMAALHELQSSGLHYRVIEAETEAAVADLLLRQGRAHDGLTAARHALGLLGHADDERYASALPARRALLALLPEGPEVDRLRQDIAAVEASYRP